MFVRLLTVAVMTFMAPVGISLAEQTNLSSIKCADFLSMDEPNVTSVMTWLQGYYTYEDDPVVVDMEKEKSNETQIKQYCTDHRDTDLVNASAIFMDKKYKD
jgi:hypothetical protein